MRLLWHENGWEDYLWWQTQDKKTIKRINLLIRDMQRSPFDGIGKPEPLRKCWFIQISIKAFGLTCWYSKVFSLSPWRGRALISVSLTPTGISWLNPARNRDVNKNGNRNRLSGTSEAARMCWFYNRQLSSRWYFSDFAMMRRNRPPVSDLDDCSNYTDHLPGRDRADRVGICAVLSIRLGGVDTTGRWYRMRRVDLPDYPYESWEKGIEKWPAYDIWEGTRPLSPHCLPERFFQRDCRK